jgi:glycosyltransferase involved in cell wall biosynthesis
MNEMNRIPFVSVIVPCRNEEKYILRCIQSVLDNDYNPGKVELLVCDGKSTDRTAEIVKKEAKTNNAVKYFLNEEGSTPVGLNLGIRNARGEVILILGAHAEIAGNYITKCITVLAERPEVWCTGGVLENVCEDKASESIALAMSSPFGVGDAHFRTGKKDGYVDTVAFGAYRKEIFEKIGLFDEKLIRNQDDELNYRILKNGGKIWLIASTYARYHVRSSFTRLFRQFFQYGYWKVFVNQKHNTITTYRQIVPAIFVAGLYTVILGAVLFPATGIFFVLYWVLYLAVATGFALRLTGKLNQILQVLLSFFILHAGYGNGYIKGFFDFVLLRRNPSAIQSKLTR